MPSKNEIVSSGIRLLLRPVLRLCVRNSLKLQEIVEMVKLVLIQVAKEELSRKDQPVSESKLSVITGVHRKDVSRLEKAGGDYKRPDNQIAKVMTQWQCDQRFTTKAGKPRMLDCSGKTSEFADLVASVNGRDVSSYSILFEMERMALVERSGTKLRLKGRDFILGGDLESGFRVLAEDTNDLISAVEENLFEESAEKNLHLRTEFDRIPLEKLESAKKWLLEQGSLFHKRARRYFSTLDLDTSPKSNSKKDRACGRVALGTFGITEELPTCSEEKR
ncbi:MAG: hypothetical protein KDD64_03650 [Bdellovibrionales bacterium]|nr:hypothetical protein [Bdellovibrionales bacterium]